MIKEVVCLPHVVIMLMLLVCAANLDLATTSAPADLGEKKLFDTHEGFKLVGHVIESVATDEFGCGLRCLRKRNCRSYNSHSDSNHSNTKCELSDQTRQSSPENLRRSPGSTYHGKVVKGWHPSSPGHSCVDIQDSGDSIGNGEYWIDPEKNGNPLKVYCDMQTASGGWLLIFNLVIGNHSPPPLSLETSYRRIDSYNNNSMALSTSALNELRTHLSFIQLRFHCRKTQGNTFHVITTSNSSGEAVIQYFTGQTDTKPASCGSYRKLSDDNSDLAQRCAEWGRDNGQLNVSKWGNDGMRELYDHPAFIYRAHHWVTSRDRSRWECDDFAIDPSPGDFWKIFVR